MSADAPRSTLASRSKRLFDHAQVGLDRRARRGVAAVHAQVNGHVEHLGPFGVVHAQEEDVAPAAVREVHPHGRAFAQDGVGAVCRVRPQQLRPDAQRLVGRVAHAEHPLVAAHRAHAPAHLVGQRLERQPVVGRRQRAADGVTRALGLLHRQETGQWPPRTGAGAGARSPLNGIRERDE